MWLSSSIPKQLPQSRGSPSSRRRNNADQWSEENTMNTTMKYASLDFGTVEAVFNKLGGLEGAAQFLRDELTLVLQPKPEPPPEPVLDFLVRVDRSVKPTHPDWFKRLEHPELECSGPAEYDLQTGVHEWLHDDQKGGSVVGNTIHKHLQKGDALPTCLNLQDGLAIQAKGIAVFRKLFADKAVFLWGSVVQYRDGRLLVPFLYEDGDRVVVLWFWLDYCWLSNEPALRFSK